LSAAKAAFEKKPEAKAAPEEKEKDSAPKKQFVAQTEKCTQCNKSVYFAERLMVDEKPYHAACFRCNHCNAALKLGNYAGIEGKLFCKPHFKQLFASHGNYSQGFADKK